MCIKIDAMPVSNGERTARNWSNFEDRFRGQRSYSSIDVNKLLHLVMLLFYNYIDIEVSC